MKLTTGILAVVMMTGAALGQNPNATDNTRSAKSLPQNQTNQAHATIAAATVPAKPAAGAPAPAVKPATMPGAKSATVKPAATSSQNNALERVNVVRKADAVQIEFSSRDTVTPKVSKLSSPARVVVELPATTMATAQSKIPVDSAGVKGVRIGTDGKTPPTTSVVVDLEQAYAYDLSPETSNKFVLTLHTQAVAKNTPPAVPVKVSAPAPKVQAAASKPVAVQPVAVKPSAVKPVAVQAVTIPSAKTDTKSKAAQTTATTTAAVKPHDVFVPKTAPVKVAEAKLVTLPAAKTTAQATTATATTATTKTSAPATTKIAADQKLASTSPMAEAPKPPKPEEKKWAMTGKRDPFFSPVVQQTSGSGCSTGKKCLEIGQINLRGVVKAESGFIAVVTNSLNKAYFLHENDPVFNGYVVRITGDSVVFEETVQDKLGKAAKREVVKKIFTPAV
jgi:Tfp pilus assembly protein PilP